MHLNSLNVIVHIFISLGTLKNTHCMYGIFYMLIMNQ